MFATPRKHIAAYHVLHRLSAPRHPPNALKSLDRSHYQCPSWDSPVQFSAKNERDGHRSLERLNINILCLILPVVGRSSATVRGSRTNTDKSLLHDVNERSARDCIAAKLDLGRPGRSRVFIMACLREVDGGARRDRTDDLKLAKLALSQLSYVPSSDHHHLVEAPERYPNMVGLGRVELPTSRLSSARSNQLSYRPNSASAPSCDLKERETKTAVSRQMDRDFRSLYPMTLR